MARSSSISSVAMWVDLLSDRDATSVKNWFDKNSCVEVVSRDRSSAFARAVSESVPNAQQVADRWHLMKNLREVIERLFERESALISTALKPAQTAVRAECSSADKQVDGSRSSDEPVPSPPATELSATSPRSQLARTRRQRRVERFQQVQERFKQGQSVRRIARELGMARCSVKRYLRSSDCPDWNPRRRRRSRLDQHRAWIDTQLQAEMVNAADLYRRLSEMGFRGSYGSVRRYVAKRLAAIGKPRARINASRPAPIRTPTAKQLSYEWACRNQKREPDAQTRLDAIRASSDELADALSLADQLAALIRKPSRSSLGEWLKRADSSAYRK